MKKAIKNSGTIREKNLRIEILDYINVHLSDEVEVKTKLIPSGENNIGIILLKKSDFDRLVFCYENGINETEEKICKEVDFLTLIRNEDVLTLRVEYTPCYNSRDKIIVEMSDIALSEFIANVKNELSKIDWETYGKIEYHYALLPSDEEVSWNVVTSAYAFKKLLNQLINGKTLRMLLVDMFDFLEEEYREYPTKHDYVHFYDSGSILLVFDDMCVELVINAIGIFHYRIIDGFGISKITKSTDYIPEEIYDDTHRIFIMGEAILSETFSDKPITSVAMKTADYVPFGSNKELDVAAKNNDLPATLSLVIDDAFKINFIGDDIEYYALSVERFREA